MKYLTTVVLLLTISSISMGEVSTRVCLADANTPLELADPNFQTDPNVLVYRDIMVGTKLTIIVNSNNITSLSGSWSGGLYMFGSNRDYGELSARDYNDITLDWEGSRFESAGEKARVWGIVSDVKSGFNLRTYNTAVEGDWFVLDYNAEKKGICKVDFYDLNLSGDYPLYSIEFFHVSTRDFNQDSKVDFADFALLALYWLQTDCSDPDWCAGTDLNADGVVNHDDLVLFADFWLEKTE